MFAGKTTQLIGLYNKSMLSAEAGDADDLALAKQLLEKRSAEDIAAPRLAMTAFALLWRAISASCCAPEM